MERFLFIHGSSVGQSTLIPTDNPVTKNICNDIADKYFGGRVLRQKESATKLGLFVELYKSSYGETFCVYSFVNNSCRGAVSSDDSKGRDGQYFAMSILCKNTYVYPEELYVMLYSAYRQMVETGRVMVTNRDGESQYVIPQFELQKDFLIQFLNNVGKIFDQVSSGNEKKLASTSKVANYDSWNGIKVNLDTCNSIGAYKQFCDNGRMYISEEYESSSKRIKTLEADVQRLKVEKANMESRLVDTARSEKSKVRNEIEDLTRQLQQKDLELQKLKQENEDCNDVINTISRELEKYAKIGDSIVKVQKQGQKTQSQSKSNKDILKLSLLFLILIITVLSGLMNYAFFRGLPPFSKQETKKEMQSKREVNENKALEVNENPTQNVATSLVVTPDNVEFESVGGEKVINITTDGEWDLPSTATSPWISLRKEGSNKMVVLVQSNDGEARNSTLMIKSGRIEKQISISQKREVIEKVKKECPDYRILVTDVKTGVSLKSGDKVTSGQVLKAVIENPNPNSSGYGWCYSNCKGNKKNIKEVSITVGTDSQKNVVFSYGDLNDSNLRKRMVFKLQSVVNENMDADTPVGESVIEESAPQSDIPDNK